MSFFKNIEAGLNSGLDALAQEYSKLDNQPAGGGSGSREEGGGSGSAEEASGSVGKRVSALLNAIEPGSLSNLEQSASGALKAFTPKLPVTPSLKLPSTDGLFPGFPGDATEVEDEVTAAAATETNASPPEAAEAARRIAEAEARAAAAEERAAAAETRAATAETMAEDVEMRAEAAVEEAEARAAIAEDVARHGLARAPAGEAEAAEAVPGEMPAEIAAALNVSSPRARPRAVHPPCTRPAPDLCPLHLRHPRRPLPAGGPRRGGLGGRARARRGGGAARGARGGGSGGGGGGGSGDAT